MEKRQSTRDRAKTIARHVFRSEYGILTIVLIALVCTMGIITKGLMLRAVNLQNILLQSSTRGVASIGQAFVILSAGIDISVAGVGLFSAILGATLMTSTNQNIIGHPISPFVVVPIMLLVGASWGALNGTLVSRLGLPALIVTLGMWQITNGGVFQLSGGFSIGGLPESLTLFGRHSIAGVTMPVIYFIVAAVISYFVTNYTIFGRTIYATGGNPVSAWLSGVNIKKTLFSVYVISGFLAALAGIMMTARTMSVSGLSLGGLEIDSIAAATVGGVSLMGGRGNMIGVVIGVLIIGVINNGMSILGATPAVQGIAKGTIIIVAVAIDYLRKRS